MPASPRPRPHARAFALIELAAIIVVCLLLVALLIAGADSRRLGRLSEDTAKLRAIGAATGAYTADNSDLCWAFSWKRNQVYQTQFPDLNNAPTDLAAAANQAIYILRTKGHRNNFPVISSWIPHLLYSHLVISDYLDQKLPSRAFISAADTHRTKWAADPVCFEQGCFSPNQPFPDGTSFRWAYSASFQLPAAFYDRAAAPNRISQGSTHNTYLVPGMTDLGALQFSSVKHPSQKVMLHDQNARHFRPRQPYCTHPEARLPLLMADGSAPVRSAANSNLGWNPNNPASPATSQFTYSVTGSPWEPPSISSGGDFVQGRFRWTRQGLAGRDFGGPEVRN